MRCAKADDHEVVEYKDFTGNVAWECAKCHSLIGPPIVIEVLLPKNILFGHVIADEE